MAQLVERRIKREEEVGGRPASIPKDGEVSSDKEANKDTRSPPEWSLFVIMLLEAIMGFVGQLLETLHRGTVKEDLLVETEK